VSADERFRAAVEVVLQHEGGLSEHPSDPGGVTHWGISLTWLQRLGLAEGDIDGDGDVDADDVRALSRERAIELYRRYWWEPLRLSEVRDLGVATKILDLAVNMGSGPAVRLLQQALRVAGEDVAVDGILGSQTLGAVNRVNPALLLELYRVQAARYYHQLVDRRPELVVFERGWLRRALA